MNPLVPILCQAAMTSPGTIVLSSSSLHGINVDCKGSIGLPVTLCSRFANTFAIMRYIELDNEMGLKFIKDSSSMLAHREKKDRELHREKLVWPEKDHLYSSHVNALYTRVLR